MTRQRTPARTSAIATLMAVSVVLCAAPNAAGQAEIPLQDVISPQYQAPAADVAAQVVEAVQRPRGGGPGAAGAAVSPKYE